MAAELGYLDEQPRVAGYSPSFPKEEIMNIKINAYSDFERFKQELDKRLFEGKKSPEDVKRTREERFLILNEMLLEDISKLERESGNIGEDDRFVDIDKQFLYPREADAVRGAPQPYGLGRLDDLDVVVPGVEVDQRVRVRIKERVKNAAFGLPIDEELLALRKKIFYYAREMASLYAGEIAKMLCEDNGRILKS